MENHEKLLLNHNENTKPKAILDKEHKDHHSSDNSLQDIDADSSLSDNDENSERVIIL